MSPAAKAGDLVRVLSGDEENRYRAGRGAPPREGVTVSLWRLPGRWSVWSPGPSAGTWWLVADDDEAAAVIDAAARKLSRVQPVVVALWKHCIAVRARDIRSGAPVNR